MKYKIGDKVILKDDLETLGWEISIKEKYDDMNPKTVTIIKIVNKNFEDLYQLKEILALWREKEIIGIYKEHESIEMDEPIKNRWEILDIR